MPHIASKQKFVGFVYDQPDAESAIKAAIEEYNVAAERARPPDGAAAGLI